MELDWEKVKGYVNDFDFGRLPKTDLDITRAKVKGGWLVSGNSGLTFVPDPNHEWQTN